MADVYTPPASDKCYGTASGLFTGSYLYIGDWGEDFDAMFLFSGIVANSGDTVDSAILSVRAASSYSTTPIALKVHLNDVDNAAIPGNAATYLALSLTTGTVWTISSSWTTGTYYDSSDIKDEVQSVLNRAGWSSGNSLLVVVQDNGSGASKYRKIYSRNYSALYAAQLELTISSGGGFSKKVYGATPGKIYGISVANIAKVYGG